MPLTQVEVLTTQTTLFEAGVGGETVITGFWFFVHTNLAGALDVFIVPDGGTIPAVNSSKVFTDAAPSVNTSIFPLESPNGSQPFGLCLSPGDQIIGIVATSSNFINSMVTWFQQSAPPLGRSIRR